jgi:hypothetical protein
MSAVRPEIGQGIFAQQEVKIGTYAKLIQGAGQPGGFEFHGPGGDRLVSG